MSGIDPSNERKEARVRLLICCLAVSLLMGCVEAISPSAPSRDVVDTAVSERQKAREDADRDALIEMCATARDAGVTEACR